MPSIIYQIDQLPATTGWIYELNALDAIEQCRVFGIESGTTLSANRALIREYLAVNHGFAATAEHDQEPAARFPATATYVSRGHFAPPVAQTATSDVNTEVANILQATILSLGPQLATAIGSAIGAAAADKPKRVPKVIEDLVASISITSGENAEQLVRFFIKVKGILKLNIHPEKEIILHLLTRTTAQLQNIWSEAIASQSNFDQLTENVLLFFFPPRVQHDMLTKLFYRQQGCNEPLIKFCTELVDIAGILQPKAADREVLEVVLTGLRPEVRALLAGFPVPLTTTDLIALAPKINHSIPLQPVHQYPSFQQSPNRTPCRPPYRPRQYYQYNQTETFHQQPFRGGASPRYYNPRRQFSPPYNQGNARGGK